MTELPFLDRDGRIAPPPKQRLLREVRALLTPRPRLARLPALQAAPRGDGHPVFVLPGFLTNDGRTRYLRTFLSRLGYVVYGWGRGVNWGPTDRALASIERRLHEIHRRHGRPVTLVGHSLGGVLARDLAKKFPAEVRQVVMMGSPAKLPTATSLDVFFRLLARFHRTAMGWDLAEVNRPPPDAIPVTALYTRDDGIVAWQSCLEMPGPRRENIEVRGNHSTLPSNPEVLLILADRLAQPETTWRPYEGLRPRVRASG
jgi:pimeloyl-ACP methyl ester carboxylesterase